MEDGIQRTTGVPEPPALELVPFTAEELWKYFQGGEPEADACERLLASAARLRGALDVAIAEGLFALTRGTRLAELGFYLDDYAREVLDLGKRTAENLVRLGGGLGTRPLLRAALLSGRVQLRAAETVLPVAKGDDEARWVERAAAESVRALEEAVRRVKAGACDDDADEPWFRLRTHLPPEDRELLDAALARAGEVLSDGRGGSAVSQTGRIEALAQEFLATLALADDGVDPERLSLEWREIGEGEAPRRATLEAETERWSHLAAVRDEAVPLVSFDTWLSAKEVDARLRELARARAGWDELLGYCGLAVKRSGLYELAGFASFRHYLEERLRVPPRAVEQRIELEARIWGSAGLQEARRQKVPYEKLRVLAKLLERDVAGWIARAKAWTAVKLRREVVGERERQRRASDTFSVSLPKRVAVLLAAAFDTLRKVLGKPGYVVRDCLAMMSLNFLGTWEGAPSPRQTRSRKVRARDGDVCQVPGCSRPSGDGHHVVFRSRGGSDDPTNQVGLCSWHHHRCIHDGFMTVEGEAPDGLAWFVGGEPFTGMA